MASLLMALKKFHTGRENQSPGLFAAKRADYLSRRRTNSFAVKVATSSA